MGIFEQFSVLWGKATMGLLPSPAIEVSFGVGSVCFLALPIKSFASDVAVKDFESDGPLETLAQSDERLRRFPGTDWTGGEPVAAA